VAPSDRARLEKLWRRRSRSWSENATRSSASPARVEPLPAHCLLQGAPCQHRREAASIVRAPTRVAWGIAFGRDCFRRRADVVGRSQCLFGRAYADRCRAHVRERDRRIFDRPVRASDNRRHADGAQSWARRVNFRYDQPLGPSFGTRISVSTSCGPSAVSKTPRKNSPAGTVRSPSGPCRTRSAWTRCATSATQESSSRLRRKDARAAATVAAMPSNATAIKSQFAGASLFVGSATTGQRWLPLPWRLTPVPLSGCCEVSARYRQRCGRRSLRR